MRAAYLALLVVAGTALVSAQQAPADLNARLPLDKAIRTGTLPNGMTYYIRKNSEPKDRAMMRLAVKAGSVDEADDQRGLAHVLEHMAFNGTKHFPPGELVKYLESIGAQFGPHVNAYTSYDETVYMLDVPTDRAGTLEHALQALSDFAGGMSLEDSEIDKERGVVLEEWRLGLGAESRLRDAQMPILLKDARYADRSPIGRPKIIQNVSPARLRQFYTD